MWLDNTVVKRVYYSVWFSYAIPTDVMIYLLTTDSGNGTKKTDRLLANAHTLYFTENTQTLGCVLWENVSP